MGQSRHRFISSFAANRIGSFVRRLPRYTYLGLFINALSWWSSWERLGPWPHTFFPLWLGCILVLDGVNVARSGTSIMARGPRRFVALFLYSVPAWWIFEAFNAPLQNWHYRLDHHYGSLEYNLWSSLAFSTVLPAVMEMAELVASIPGLRPRLGPHEVGPRLTPRTAALWIGLGLIMFALTIVVPHYAFGLVWGCLVFSLDPINNLARRKSAFAHALAGDWRFLIVLPLAALLCGFLWEMWNSRALPGWYYTVPFIDRGPHLFEMPIPGYLGYLPFGLELFAMYQFALQVTRIRGDGLAL